MDSSWFARHPVDVAIEMIGGHIFVTRDNATVGGRIVETEAYGGRTDAASHSARMRAAFAVMSGPVGLLYVYRSYGIHTCVNIVAHLPNEAGAVLIRAIEPTLGQEIMRARRGDVPDERLARGPGNVGQALAISLDDIGESVVNGNIVQFVPRTNAVLVHASPRIGISKAMEASWRFYDPDSRAVSSHRRGQPVLDDDRDALRNELTPLE